MDTNTKIDGGISALFDLSFTRFITVSMVRLLYLLGMVVIALGWIIGVIAGLRQSIGAGFLALIVMSILALIYLIGMRIWLELVVVIFRIGENTATIAQSYAKPTGGFPVTPLAPASPLS